MCILSYHIILYHVASIGSNKIILFKHYGSECCPFVSLSNYIHLYIIFNIRVVVVVCMYYYWYWFISIGVAERLTHKSLNIEYFEFLYGDCWKTRRHTNDITIQESTNFLEEFSRYRREIFVEIVIG